jgi:hypothetical protein
MTTNELKDQVKKEAVRLVENLNGIKYNELNLKLLGEFPELHPELIMLCLSEVAQDGMVKRIEWMSPRRGYHYSYLYLPYDAKIS